MQEPLIQSPLGVLVTLSGVTAFFLWFEKWSKWKLFDYAPSLLFVYAVPMALSSTGVLASQSPVYGWMKELVLPMFLVLMLLEIDVVGVSRVMGRGVLVFLMGSAGVVCGACLSCWLIKGHLAPDTWKAFGALTGSWIGGSGNMAAVATGLNLKQNDPSFTLAVLGDMTIFLLWIPLLLGSKNATAWFNRFTRVNSERIKAIERASAALVNEKAKLEMRHVLYLLFLGLGCAWLSSLLAPYLPVFGGVLTAESWGVLITTTLAIMLSFTPARNIPGGRPIAVALIYLFVARIGASADVSGLAGQAIWFILGAFVWITVHGTFCVVAARVLHVDLATTTIASTANIGGIATATIMATHHNENLVPVGVLMALLGYALGNYGGFLAAWLCKGIYAGW